ncbi:uncharacterized protein LOC144659949 [Oculina patagonica]
MFAKFIIVAIVAKAILFQNKAMAQICVECPECVKLNTSPVCFGTKDDQYGSFSYGQDISVRQFMLVYRSGTVSCSTNPGRNSNWGCDPNTTSGFRTILTDQQNTIVAPDPSTIYGNGLYNLTGYTSSSSFFMLCADPSCTPLAVPANSELRLSYGPDLRDVSESDNSGETCADVYALLA